MAYMIYRPGDAVRVIEDLTGLGDAEPGDVAVSPEGDRYSLTPDGWVKVWHHETGADFDPEE